MEDTTVAALIARTCAAHGVQQVFGVPGGGSSLDLIEALRDEGIEFRLCRTETGAALMAAADAEIRNAFGVVITTQGPGTASAMNGIAHASLDRAPVLFITDGWTARQAAFDTHQVFDQQAMSAPVVKGHSRLESPAPQAELDALVRRMFDAPWGPVHIELTSENARRRVCAPASPGAPGESPVASAEATAEPLVYGDPAGLISTARRPAIVVGLEARGAVASRAAVALAERMRCPVFTTYKAKGTVPDDHPWMVGHFTGGAAERQCLDKADLIILYGMDPVELIGRPWPYTVPVVDLSLCAHPVHYVDAAAAIHGDLVKALDSLECVASASEWGALEVAQLRETTRRSLRYSRTNEVDGLSPVDVVEIALESAAGARPYVTVDAGAHMFSAMAFWQAHAPQGALISNGLASMGYALPAAIARSMNTPDVPTIAFTGDGGLLMCAGELLTAVQHGCRLCVVVFNDSALSLIALKQSSRGMAAEGVSWPAVDLAACAAGLGFTSRRVRTPAEYRDAMEEALRAEGPWLIDVKVDASGYRDQARALRG